MARRDASNSTRYWNDRQVDGLSLMCADFTTHEFAPHRHEALVIAITEHGGATFRSRGVADYAQPASVLVFNPAEPHSGRMGWSRRWRYRAFYMNERAIDTVTAGLGLSRTPYFTRNLLLDDGLAHAFLRLHRLMETGDDSFATEEALHRSFARLFDRHGSTPAPVADGPADRSIVARTVDIMRAQIAEELSLAALSRPHGLTPFQLIRAFRKTTGLTPHAYLMQLRLDAACQLLRAEQPLAEVAGAAGFYDQSAMSRHFRRCLGVTPLQFARAVRAEARPQVQFLPIPARAGASS